MDVGHEGVTWAPNLNPDGDELSWMRREGQDTKGYPPNEWWTYGMFSEGLFQRFEVTLDVNLGYWGSSSTWPRAEATACDVCSYLVCIPIRYVYMI